MRYDPKKVDYILMNPPFLNTRIYAKDKMMVPNSEKEVEGLQPKVKPNSENMP